MSKQPLYKKIYQELKKDILTGVYLEETQVPTELELSEKYDVSRITSKRALMELETEGLIYRVRGKGSFVKKRQEVAQQEKNNTLLFVMPFAQNEGLGNYAEGILASLNASDYRLHMQSHDWLQTEDALYLSSDYAGVIYYPINMQESIDFLYQCHMQNIPVVLLDKQIEKIHYPCVVADNESGGSLASKELISKGYDEVIFVSGTGLTESSSVRDRYMGYLSAVYEASLIPQHIVKTPVQTMDQLFESVYDVMCHNKKESVGLVCENDIVAIRLMTYLKQQGMDIGEKIGIIGFDNIQATQLVDPPLTTIAQDFYRMGEVAGEVLLKQLNKEPVYSLVNVIPVSIIPRQST
ncbi:hypothetical protein BW731_03145 [Vagococcus martis]|uniref:HTH gntR-type domain-containing protein n=1 Tax=Vagococcus martis TaxID=1768210 RepID=A0A1V4DFM7_9ENTE|nr:LacI family DNA-binding transcriptional regulator [Vagococcus martis]OPF87275.1 hypothetical protein BW731_03145 [Vagococcus martis]